MQPRTEREKMLAGETYNCLDPELLAVREESKALLWRHNQTEAEADRRTILGQLLGSFGRDAIIESPFYCIYGRHIHVGDHTYLNVLCTMVDCNEIRIGRHVMIGPGVHIYTAAHALQAEARIRGLETARPVTVEDNVWIGGRAVLLPGVTIGRNAVVGAGAVVTHDVESDVVVAGNPARVIRKIEQDHAPAL